MVSEGVQPLFLASLWQDSIHSVTQRWAALLRQLARSGGKWGRVGLGEDTRAVLTAREGAGWGTCV